MLLLFIIFESIHFDSLCEDVQTLVQSVMFHDSNHNDNINPLCV